jgi:hypothetical protein
MRRALPSLVALLIVLVANVVHGMWTGRWIHSHVLDERVAALARVPNSFSEWKGEDQKLDKGTTEAAGIAGYLMRTYHNSQGELVQILIVCGRPGPISVHTPEVCYAGAGYVQTSEATRTLAGTAVSGRPSDFWALDFQKPGPTGPDRIRIYYAWGTGSNWRAADNPRIEFAGTSAIYKIYLVRPAPTPEQDATLNSFAQDLLPELSKALEARTTS